MATDREIAGIRCTEVLALLSDYVDGELDPPRRAQVEAHVAACSWCEAFGGAFGATIAHIRAHTPDPAPADVRDRVLRQVAGRGAG